MKKKAKTIKVRVVMSTGIKFNLKMVDFIKYNQTYKGEMGEILKVKQWKQ
jgi:hypothetical protein